MIILEHRHSHHPSRPHTIAVFGAGLVGGAIVRSLIHAGAVLASELPLDWRSGERQQQDLERIRQTILPNHRGGHLERLDLVWAAGKAGFGATWAELDGEMTTFENIIRWAVALHGSASDMQVNLHMLSSAGGLFEGQRFVNRESQARPLRPYGATKLQQEIFAQRHCTGMGLHIYRPSSVYGFGGPKGRSGLVNTLIQNATKHAASRIFGDMDTVRDYILASDIGSFVARGILTNVTLASISTLASGKPTSIMEMLRIIGRVVERPLYLKLESSPSNAGHITFSPSILPAHWRPTDLETGVRQTARHLGLYFERGPEGGDRAALFSVG
ncbi:NAD-dependent epimerase/dehydratase family protein [Ancylobacter radicis]|uniref:NAD-dependent epimerase/dehydratase family protein n=1 Tax=Ancylobacter radicis TaxID=2836179 RepID=A0ABS5RAM1_9HYPH|nr:NAD-dependent epimerase/dehydratase family protein [Ancylobacter radicis]MBS9478340.1 NAD-dependent epimerase/dehydratase family protein [Ancylobacter radicis]